MRLRTLAPAKLNLCLYLGARRRGGLHEICSLFAPVTLADDLVLEGARGDADEVVCPGVDGPNLAAEALAAFRNRFGWEGPPVRLAVDKKIPVAAGLGGGSADAAAALRLAAEASGIAPDPAELRELAMSLGADVPSQLEPALQLVTGAGERLERLDGLGGLAAVLLTAEDGLSTHDVYTHAESTYPPRRNLGEIAQQIREAVSSAGEDPLALGELLHNDLQASAAALQPSVGDALDLLRSSGARAALATGSGPTVFGLYEGAAEAERARLELSPEWHGEALAVGAAT